MSELFDEVDEEVRRDQLKKLWDQYSLLIIAGVILIIAAVGAMILGHRERVGGKVTQREMMERRFREGGQLTPLPGPGVYAGTDAADQPLRPPTRRTRDELPADDDEPGHRRR